jgi:hypothetical protein
MPFRRVNMRSALKLVTIGNSPATRRAAFVALTASINVLLAMCLNALFAGGFGVSNLGL